MPRPNGRLTLEERLETLKRDNFKCVKCGRGGRYSDWILQVDHINGIPTDHRPENRQTLCIECHDLKTYGHLTGKATTFSERKRRANK